MLFTIPLGVPELLIKADVKTAKVSVNLGSWSGLKVIAIGPKGGKIVGYGTGGKPIYAGTPKAQTLAKVRQLAVHPSGLTSHAQDVQAQSILDWLNGLDIHAKHEGGYVAMSPAAGEMLTQHFAHTPVSSKKPGAWIFQLSALLPHAGKPFHPPEDEHTGWAAAIASGDDQNDPFPKLDTLTEIPAGMYAGSHGNKLFQTPDGKKWVFKGEDPTIARAEEAAARVQRLMLGDRVPASKHVTVNGQSGVLIQVIPGEPLNKDHGASASQEQLKKYAGQIAEHFVADWLTSNHDGHSGNFLADGSQLNAIDKGQAWKFFGKDQLSPDYKPNPSKTIYNKFWNAVGGSLGAKATKEAMDALAKAVAKAETITPDQFKLIVAPYVATAAAHMGYDPATRLDAMAKRLETLRADMEKFASGVMGTPWTLEKPKSADNFETMPEAEPKEAEAPKLVIQNPDKPAAVVGGATQPPVVNPAPGWPVTKKDTTIHAPGDPPPAGVKWPGGLPGPGFILQTKYKGKEYTLYVAANATKTGPELKMVYPDGSTATYDSLNKAGDSLYLFHNGLPLTMSATEKKAKKIALGSKAFKLDSFKDELAAATGGVVAPSVMAPAELEAAKVVPEGAKEVSLTDLIAKHPVGLVTDKATIPWIAQVVVEESLTHVMGSQYVGAPPPGTVILTKDAKGEPMFFVAKVKSDGTAGYDVFFPGKLGWTQDSVGVPYANETFGLDKIPDVQAWTVKPLPESPKQVEPAGPPPAAELPSEGVVQNPAPKLVAQPLTSGTEVKVKKKFKTKDGGWEQKYVKLTALDGGKFQVQMENEYGNVDTSVHDSLSAASDHVWVWQQGYNGVASYKEATGKKKIPSGGGWKFWGITPKPDAEAPAPVVPMPAPSPEPKVVVANWAKMPETLLPLGAPVAVDKLPVGAKLFVSPDPGEQPAVWGHQEGGGWKLLQGADPTGATTQEGKTVTDDEMANWVVSTKTPMGLEMPEGYEAPEEPKAAPSESNFETMPEALPETGMSQIVAMVGESPTGSKVYFGNGPGLPPSVWEKQPGKEGWKLTQTAIEAKPFKLQVVDNTAMFNWVYEALNGDNTTKKPVAFKEATGATSDWQWFDENGVAPSVAELSGKLEALPVGTVITAKDIEGPVVWKKLGADQWEAHFTSSGKGSVIHDTNKGAAKFMQLDATNSGTVPTLGSAPEPAPAKAPPKTSKLGNAKLVLDPAEIGAAEPNKYANMVVKTLGDWKEKHELLVQKPSGWDAWVPPPGVLVKGTKDGVDYYLVVSTTGHNNTEDHGPGEQVTFAIIHPGGYYGGKGMKSAAAALKYVANEAGLGDNVKELKKLFGLEKTAFAPGESYFTLKSGTGPSALPYAADVLETPVAEMTPAEKTQPVKMAVPLSSALKVHPTLGKKLKLVPVKGKPELMNICLDKNYGGTDAPEDALMNLAVQYGFETTLINKGGVPKKNHWGGAYMTIPTSLMEQEVTVATSALEAAGITPEAELPKPKPKPAKAPSVPDPVKEALKEKAKAVGVWAGKNPTVTDPEALTVLAHFQKYVKDANTEIGMWARRTEGGTLLLGSEHADFHGLMKEIGLATKPVETPLGTFYEVTTAEVADATPGKPALGTVTGPDGKDYPKGTTFKQKTVEHTIEDLLKEEPGFYKYKPHNTDPNTVVVKMSGNGETQKQQLEAMLTKYSVPFSGIISGGSNTLAFVQKADIAKVGKTETVTEAKTPKPPPDFSPAALPLLGSGGAMWSEVKSQPAAEFAAIPGMKPSPFGKVVLMGKPGILRDFQVSVRRVKAADGKIYHEVSGQLANYDETAGKLTPSSVAIPTGATKKGTLNYNEAHGYTDESGDGAGSITTNAGYKGDLASGTKVEVMGDSNPTFKHVFRVRIPEGKDVESELGQAFEAMGFDPADAMAPLDDKSERIYKKWSIVRGLMGAYGWQKALKAPKQIHSEKWLDAQLAERNASHLVSQATIRQTFEGHASVVLEDGEKFKDAGWKFAYRNDADANSLFYQLSQGVGWASRKTKYLNGSYSAGWSPSADLANGGATGAFFRVAQGTSSIGDHGIVAHPRVFERADWWRYNGDNYGNISGHGSGSISNTKERYSMDVGHSNEIMFAGGIALADVMAVTTSNESEKKDLIKKLNDVGIEQVNGVPLQDFILVGGHDIMSRVHPSLKAT